MFFNLSAWVFIFIIPAITMKSFAEEKNTETLELLFTLPISKKNIILEKFIGYFLILFVIIIFTLIYVFSIYQLGFPKGNLDIASTFGSYIGLLFLLSTFISIGIFSSSIANKQMTAFFIGVFLCFFIFYGIDALSSYNILGSYDFLLKQFGLKYHYLSISRGVLDTRDLAYFLIIICSFLWFTQITISIKKDLKKNGIILGILILFGIASNYFYTRIDLTEDKRYSISYTTKVILDDLEEVLKIKVYLDGDFPSGFKRLSNETKTLIEEYQFYNPNISFDFINPLDLEKIDRDKLYKSFREKRLQPTRLQVEKNGEFNTKLIFPYAKLIYKNKSSFINLLSTQRNIPKEEQLNNSIQTLEYKISNAINFLTKKNKLKVAFSTGHKEAEDIYLMDAIYTLSKDYEVSKIDITIKDTNYINNKFKLLLMQDILIIAKPRSKFNSKEKYLIDQYIMNGGKVIWALDFVYAETKGIENNGKTIAMPIDLNLTDLLFKYGIRINPNIIQDSYCGEIVVQTGEIAGNPQYEKRPWIYYPLLISNPNNPVVKNLELIRVKYPSGIEILRKNKNKITPILRTSPHTRELGVPREISLKEIKLWDKNIFKQKFHTIGVFVEGHFSSAYKNRVKPFDIKNNINTSKEFGKMVIFSDGDIFLNEIKNGNYLPLNIDKWTGKEFGNKNLLENIISYLSNSTDIIELRNKKFKLRLLDKKRVLKEKNKWRVINILIPILILILFGITFNFIKRKKYGK